jgi:hypothetical protein
MSNKNKQEGCEFVDAGTLSKETDSTVTSQSRVVADVDRLPS